MDPRRLRSAARSLHVVLLISLAGCATSTPSATAGGDLPAPVVARIQREGVLVTLTLDRQAVTPGTTIRAVAEVRNLGPGPVTWQSGGCELLARFQMRGPDVPQPPPGRDWDGTAHWAKWSATTSGVRLTGFVPPGFDPNPWGMACTMELRYEDTPEGGVERVEAEWPGTTSDGAPAPPGAYTVAFQFPLVGRGPAERLAPDPPEPQAIGVEIPVTVVGEPFAGIPSTIAVDRALGDRRVERWLAEVTRQELNGATIVLDGGAWQFEIRTTRGIARISISARDGQVLDVSIGPPE